ncbi:MAG TPA: response regulator [Armatimonadota bacterium]|nr:response regulator [Armatimonadota bacterium]
MEILTGHVQLKRILLVDDDDDLRELMMELFERNGYDANAVGSVAAAIDELTSSRYDLVITDYQMPEMNGDRLIARLRHVSHAPRTILMSAYPHVNQIAQQCGADGVFRKGDEVRKLFSLIAEKLG